MILQIISRDGTVYLDHTAMREKLPGMTDGELRATADDAGAARDAMPDGHKVSYYSDERLACLGELRRRGYAT